MASCQEELLLAPNQNVIGEKTDVIIPEYLEEFIDPDGRKEIKEWKDDDENKKELNDALDENDIGRIKMELLGGAPYLYKSNNDQSIINSAALGGGIDVIKMIILKHKHERTPECESEYQSQILTALKTTCQTNHCAIARKLLSEISNPIPVDYLTEAAKSGSIGTMVELFTFFTNLDVNIKDTHGNIPLHQAVKKNHIHTVQFLLNKNANPNLKNEEGRNCVHIACESADQSILYLLTTRGGNVNERDKEGSTPTLIAVVHRNESCIHILAAAGANLHEASLRGNVPLILAARKGYTSMVRELILNGASFDLKENIQFTAFQEAIEFNKDETAAMIINLTPENNYDDKYLKMLLHTGDEDFSVIDCNFIKTTKALLNRTVIKSKNKKEAEVNIKFLLVDKSGKTPDDKEFGKPYIFKDVAKLDEDIAYHGTIRLLVDRKMRQFGSVVLAMQTIFYLLFLLSLAYSLIVLGSYRSISLSEYTRGGENIVRIITELYILLYFVWDVFTEVVELFQTGERAIKGFNKIAEEVSEDFDHCILHLLRYIITGITSIIGFIFGLIFYFGKKSNILDFLGLLTLFILMILRLTNQPAQWIFATLTFLINGVRVFKLVTLIPILGPYSNIIYKILVKDVPLFSYLFLITLFIFTGGFFISLRTPYTSSGFANTSLMNDTDRVRGVDNEVQWVFLSGIRVLLESNIYDGEYLYRHLNWLAASIYLGFLFLITVVYLNVFIAQLSDTYGSVKQNAEKTFAKDRLNYILHVEYTSLLSLILDCKGRFLRKQFYLENLEISKRELYKYYGVHEVKSLCINAITENATEKDILSSIKKQQVVTRQIEEIVKFTTQPEHVTNSIPFEEVQQRDIKLLEEVRSMNENFQEKLEKSLLGLIEEKLQALK